MRRLLLSLLLTLGIAVVPLVPAPVYVRAGGHPPAPALDSGLIVHDGHLPKPARLIAPSSALHLPAGVSAINYSDLPNLPAHGDVSRYDPPVGDQGFLGSCASWATANLVAWWANRQGVRGYPFAPGYLYSKVNGGMDAGSTMRDNAAVAAHGLARLADYAQGNYDWARLPTPAETHAAATYRLRGAHMVFTWMSGDQSLLRATIERRIAAGSPVLFAFQVYPEFESASAANPYVGAPYLGEYPLGGHAVMAVAYDKYGLWIENQWGAAWGQFGYAELSWDAVAMSVMEVWAADGLHVTGPLPADPPVVAGPPRLFSTKTVLHGSTTFIVYGAGYKPGELLWATWNGSVQWMEYVRPNGTVEFPGQMIADPTPGPRVMRVVGTQGEAAQTLTYTVI